MNDQALIRRNDATLTITFTESAFEKKSEVLESVALIARVHDAASNEVAVRGQQGLANLISLVEKARKACKEPVLNFGRAIDAAAADFVEDLKSEQLRIGQLVGDFAQLEQAKARAAEQLRLAEERKLEEQRRQAELAAIRVAEAEKMKLAEQERELARLSAAANSERQKKILAEQQAEIDRQRALSEAKTHDELDRINKAHCDAVQANSERPKYEPVRAAGQRVQDDWDVQVTDIHLLYRAHPSCVKLEVLTGEIKSLLKAGVKVAGVTATPIVKAGLTRGRQPAAIEV